MGKAFAPGFKKKTHGLPDRNSCVQRAALVTPTYVRVLVQDHHHVKKEKER
jgi:hypothetical protein